MSAHYPDDEPARPWFVLTGLVIGLLVGIGYTWWIAPVIYRDASPALLGAADKDEYRRMVALAFDSNFDTGRAAARLGLLGEADAPASLDALSQRVLASDGSQKDAVALAGLAAALRETPAAGVVAEESSATAFSAAIETTGSADTPAPTATIGDAVRTATPPQPTVTQAPQTPSPTRRPTQAFTPTPNAPFQLAENTSGCDPDAVPALLEVLADNANGEGVPGQRVRIAWGSGEEIFFTGLAPEIGPGYADFVMTGGVVYSVRVGEGGEVANQVSAPGCTAPDGSSYLGGVRLRFRQQ